MQKPWTLKPNNHPTRLGLLLDFPAVELGVGSKAFNLAQNAKHGTYYNSPIFTDGGIYLGNASSSRIEVAHNTIFNITDGLTIEVMFKPISSDSNAQLTKKDIQYIFRYRDTSQLRCFLWTNTGQKEINYNGVTITNNVLYHCFYTYQKQTTTMGLWVNGVLVSQNTSATGTPNTTSNTIGIGAQPGGGENADYIQRIYRMWNRCLSNQEILKLTANPWILYNQTNPLYAYTLSVTKKIRDIIGGGMVPFKR